MGLSPSEWRRGVGLCPSEGRRGWGLGLSSSEGMRGLGLIEAQNTEGVGKCRVSKHIMVRVMNKNEVMLAAAVYFTFRQLV